MVLQTVRFNDHDTVKSARVFKKYASLHTDVKFLLSKEIGGKSGTAHQQGWIHHDKASDDLSADDPSVIKALKRFSQYFKRNYKEHSGSASSTSFMRVPESYMPYILHNDSKDRVQYSDLVTNYTEAEVRELQDKYQWIEARPHKTKGTKPLKCFRDIVAQKIEELCVNDGIIDYPKVPIVFMNYYVPTKVGTNQLRLRDCCNGYLIRLEHKYPKNTRARTRLYNDIIRLDDSVGLYQTSTFSYLKMEYYNKNGSQSDTEHGEDDSGSEGDSS